MWVHTLKWGHKRHKIVQMDKKWRSEAIEDSLNNKIVNYNSSQSNRVANASNDQSIQPKHLISNHQRGTFKFFTIRTLFTEKLVEAFKNSEQSLHY